MDVNAHSINNKINRGGFSATFFLRCLDALDVKRLDLEQL